MIASLKGRAATALAGVLAVVCALGLGACSFTTPGLDEAEDTAVEQVVDDGMLVQAGTLTVALDTVDAPQAMTISDGTLDGYAIDVARALADRLGLDVAFVGSTSAEEALSSSSADIYLGATTDDESGAVVVHGEYLQNATALFAHGDADTTITADDLAAGTVGAQDGSSSQEALAQVGIVASNTYLNVNECFEALAAGEVDYVVCDVTAGAYLSRSYDDVFFAGILSTPVSYGIGYAADATDLADEVATAFDEMSTDGTLDAIHALWYGTVPLSVSDSLVSGVTAAEAPAEGDGEQVEGDMNSID